MLVEGVQRSMRTFNRATPMAGLLATVALLSACGASAPDVAGDGSGAALNGRTFVGDDVRVDGKPYLIVKGSTLRLGFDDSTVSASAGCNAMSASAQWDDAVLVVDGQSLSMTEMGCAPDLMHQDAWFADFLTSRPRLSETSSTLTLTSSDTAIVLIDEQVAVPDRDLTGTTWQLDSITSAGAVGSIPSGVTSTIEFDSDGQVLANLGCNSAGGSYRLRGDVVTIGSLATTLMACQPPASDVESEVLGFLQGELTYSIDGDSLALTAQEVVGTGPTALIYRAS